MISIKVQFVEWMKKRHKISNTRLWDVCARTKKNLKKLRPDIRTVLLASRRLFSTQNLLIRRRLLHRRRLRLVRRQPKDATWPK